MKLEKIKTTIEINSNVLVGGEPDKFSERINKYLKEGYTLIHVGQQNEMDYDGKPYPTTVAILGK